MKTRKKIVYIIIALIMLLSTSVYANDTSLSNHEIHENCLCELSEGSFNTYDDNYVLDGTCYLGHWFTTKFNYSAATHLSSPNLCVNCSVRRLSEKSSSSSIVCNVVNL